MVFFYTLASAPNMTCYVGRDKHENEELIKWGWPEDVWFHVDGHSSAHIYVRLEKGQTIADLSEDVIEECCQLTKANSIDGCKLNNIKVVYTPWANLKKTATMDAGQVSFFKPREVRSFMVTKKKADIINPLEKTKTERPVDLKWEREQRDTEERHEERMAAVAKKDAEKLQREEDRRKADLKNYVGFTDTSNMTSNKEPIDLDDFM
ncbi:Coiled-coil domain-containing protein 25-like protein [Diplonema papillatum]|nr:Coiled-coil domain-containing protein 25-like protein [Diplonema papillatum]